MLAALAFALATLNRRTAQSLTSRPIPTSMGPGIANPISSATSSFVSFTPAQRERIRKLVLHVIDTYGPHAGRHICRLAVSIRSQELLNEVRQRARSANSDIQSRASYLLRYMERFRPPDPQEPPSNSVNDEEFLRHFENQAIPFDQWCHRAHLKIAYLYLSRFPFDEALLRMRAGVRAYNAAHNVVDSPTSGYHETITQAWLQLVHTTLQQFGQAESANDFLDAQSQLGQKRVILLFYSRDRIMSAEAKASFIPPDLAPLPKPTR